MSYAVSDPDYSPYIARALYDPVRHPGPMTLSLAVAALIGVLSPLFILHQIGQLPEVDDQMRPGVAVDIAALPVQPPSRLPVLTPESRAPVVRVAYTYTPLVYAQRVSAQYTSADASELIAALGEAQGAYAYEAPAADSEAVAGPGQVVEAQPADAVAMAEPAYAGPQGDYLIAVPDEEYAAMAQ